MDYYGNNDFRDHYLSHHGILGMKWGKKNGPPYPLGSSDHSASEKKAGWRKSLGGGRNEEREARHQEKAQKKEARRQEKLARREQKASDKKTEKAAYSMYGSYRNIMDNRAKQVKIKNKQSKLKEDSWRQRQYNKKLEKLAKKVTGNDEILKKSVATIGDQIKKDGKERVKKVLDTAAYYNARVKLYDGVYYVEYTDKRRYYENIGLNSGAIEIAEESQKHRK